MDATQNGSKNHHRNMMHNENHFYGTAFVYLTSNTALKKQEKIRKGAANGDFVIVE